MRYVNIADGVPPISAISLGSWNTFSRLKFEESVDLLRRATELGVNFFDVGYYWDKPHTEVIFGRAIEVAGVRREDYVLAEKLWLWDYPAEPFRVQLEKALVRLNTPYVDLVMVSRPLPELDFIPFCEEVVELVESGLARAWGVTSWEPDDIRRAQAHFGAEGRPRPRLLQLQYNLARRSIVEGEGYARLFAETDIRLCAGNILEGGILAGHLDRDRVHPSDFAQGITPKERNIARDAGGIRDRIRASYPQLEEIARRLDATPAQVAIALALAHPHLGSALIGVTKIGDLEDNVRAFDLLAREEELRALIAPLAIAEVAHPKLFSPQKEER